MFDPGTPPGGGGGVQHGSQPPGRSCCMDKGSALVNQGSATVGTCKSFCSIGRGDPGTEC